MRASRLSARWQWAVLIVVGLIAGQALAVAGMPAGLLVGPLVIGAVMAMNGASARVAAPWFHAAQGLAGCMIGLHIDQDFLPRLGDIWWAGTVFVPLTFGCAAIAGLLAGKWAKLDREVAIWGFLPGMAGAIIAISHERGLDSRMVAFIQILRLVIVIFTMAGVAFAIGGAGSLPAAPPATLTSLVMVAGITLVGMACARWLPCIPAGASLVPLTLAVMLSASGHAVVVPEWAIMAAYLAMGLQVGLRFTPELVRRGLRALPRIAAAILVLIALCAVSGMALSLLTGTDWMSGMLATVPGSVESIALIAIASGADVTFVMTLQTIRMFAVVLLGPLVTTGVIRLSRRIAPAMG